MAGSRDGPDGYRVRLCGVRKENEPQSLKSSASFEIGGLVLRKIAYWTSTVIAAAMLCVALSYLTGSPQVVAGFNHLGYPQHLRMVLGIAKPLAAIVLLLPGLPLLKEWAYVGVSFAWLMAFIAHWQAGDGAQSLMPLGLLILLIVSYLTRPPSRRLALAPVPA
jgi:DoxX-like family